MHLSINAVYILMINKLVFILDVKTKQKPETCKPFSISDVMDLQISAILSRGYNQNQKDSDFTLDVRWQPATVPKFCKQNPEMY